MTTSVFSERPEITVRRADAGDLAAAVELLAAQLEEHEIDTTRDDVRSAIDAMLRDAERGFILLALRGDTPVGVAYLAFTWTLEYGGRVAWLEELYVLPALRGRGLGRRLLTAALEEARGRGCRAMDLEVETSHERAEHLYAREGFRLLPRRRWTRLV